MNQARVVEVWVPAAGRVGSGYLLTDRLVLTSYHVVQALAPGDQVEVRPLEVPQRTPWLAATLCWPHGAVDLDAVPEQDAALLVIDDPPGGADPLLGAVRFGQITGQDRVSCMGVGFPDAEARPDNRRDTMPVRGHLDALQARRSGMLTVHVDEGIVPRRLARGSGWAGSSGTALFCESLLVGVLATDRALADDASVLGAVPITVLGQLPGFRATLAAHGIDLRLEHASPAARQLAAYLDAARDAATKHPYAGVLPGTTPPLADVYLRQQVRPLHGQAADDHNAPADAVVAMPADDVLADPPTCVILSGPGGGKSSLLRTRLADAVERWQDGRGENLLPVLVPAAALAGASLTEALAGAVFDLGLVDALPAAFFATPPRPGGRWLVLVDGLDEVTDPALRRRILGKVALASSRKHSHLYRFVIATRPLPDGELDALGTGVPRYDLQPFDHDDLETVARGWFHAALLPDPADTARRFVETLERSRLAALARVPLMTAMLCQLHAAAPDQPLPANRGQIYRKFIILLRKSQPLADAPGARYPRLERYPEAHADADVTLMHLQDLIECLAAERHAGNTLPALAIVQSRPEGRCPKGVLAEDWSKFLDTSLRRSGLFTARGGDLVFLHQTLLEHLAARHIMNDPHTATQALRDVFHQPRGERWRRYFGPGADPSYVGFLLDAAHDNGLPAGAQYLSRMTGEMHMGLPGWEFIVTLHSLGTFIPQPVRHITADRLHSLALDSDERVKAAGVLAGLGDVRGADLLGTFARDTTLPNSQRVEAARMLAGLNVACGADLLSTLARDTTLDSYARARAAEVLAGLNDARGADLLHDFARDSAFTGNRARAAEVLARLGDVRGADLLGILARDTTLPNDQRVSAVRVLAEFKDPRAADLLHDFARDFAFAPDSEFARNERVWAAEVLAGLNDARGADLLLALARDTTLYRLHRMEAAKVLAEFKDPRAADLLHDFARDSAFNRVWAAEKLAGLGDARGADLLHALARDTTLPKYERVGAARRLAGLKDPRAADLLALRVGRFLRIFQRDRGNSP
ncbi:NACHT domain-containing protein [Streptomyces sp. NPDC058676]|uniref:NACHT domain-containing protein n=1 Tax=unclassified Streptomyces TaxID=2593676 RepID=UPI00366295E7